jgi:hypothetical protein
MLLVFLNVFTGEDSRTRECYVLIRELDFSNRRLSSLSEKKNTTLRKENVQICNNAVRLQMRLSRGFLTE